MAAHADEIHALYLQVHANAKLRLGCKPEPTIVWARHRHPLLNKLLQPLLKLVQHDEAPDVEPFKT